MVIISEVEDESPKLLSNPYPTVIISKQGPRPTNEDSYAVNIINSCYVLAVFDGHGGSDISHFLSKFFLNSLINIITKYTQAEEIKSSVQKYFLEIDRRLFFECVTKGIHSGSTALITIKHQQYLIIINLGDSRCVLFNQRGDVLFQTIDHKPELQSEINRIQKCGGKVYKINGIPRVNGNLSLSRAMGDFYPFEFRSKVSVSENKITYTGVNSVISPIPDVFILDLNKIPKEDDIHILLACDGLWDIVSSEKVTSFISKHPGGTQQGVINLIDKVLPQSTDNITCILSTFRVSQS